MVFCVVWHGYCCIIFRHDYSAKNVNEIRYIKSAVNRNKKQAILINLKFGEIK